MEANTFSLIFTDSKDVTTDVLLPYIENSSQKVFRFNFDLFDEYDFSISANDFLLKDPHGRIVNLSNVKKAYYRKPIKQKFENELQEYAESEKWAMFKELVHFLWEQNKMVLVEPFAQTTRLNKMYQMRVAQKFFQTPNTLLSNKIQNNKPSWKNSVAKSISGEFIGRKVVFTTVVDTSRLQPNFPWSVQEYINATYDLTIVYVRGKIFGFELKRDFLDETVDFRSPTNKNLWERWKGYIVNADFAELINTYMKEIKLDYGRIDFLLTENSEIIFLEVNPNGQFAWLDLENEHGLLSAIASEISPDTEINPIPYYPFR